MPFLRSIFDPFLAFARFAICLFYGAFWISGVVLDPFWDPFLNVHLTAVLTTFGFVSLARDFPRIVFDVTQRAQRGTSQGTAVVEPFHK